MLTHAPWSAVPGLRHGFLGRHDAAGTRGDRCVVIGGVQHPVAVPRQVHGTRVLTADPGAAPPEADGLATAGPELVGVVTADCVPVLVLDPGRRAAAAVHAGWRGMSAGVLEAGLAHLGAAFGSRPGDLEVVIGPAAGGCCYEVGSEVRDAFRARSGGTTDAAWAPRGPRWHVDLRAAARLLLLSAGVRRADTVGPCTVCDPGYHSYRRDGAGCGRQLSFVGWA